MDNRIAVRVKNLSKKYRLYKKPTDRFFETFSRKTFHREFEAIKNVSFEIPKGQSVGIVGKNGSGKSTLLKMLTGVVTPTAGEILIDGRISALLELGAGFNPELSGMENIFLNGALLGRTRQQMNESLEDIIDFADIGEFINQPLKIYSSGMFVRLAFAVAINVDPDILIVDEALSVGDVRFQQKCIRKIQDFLHREKTVIFVGHDLGIIKSLCTHCIWLNEGSVLQEGEPAEVLKSYQAYMAYDMMGKVDQENHPVTHKEEEWIDTSQFESIGDLGAQISAFRVKNKQGEALITINGGENVTIDLRVTCNELVQRPIVGFSVKDRLGQTVFGGNSFIYDQHLDEFNIGQTLVSISFVFPFLSNGDYILTLAFADGDQWNHIQKHWIHDCYIFKVLRSELRYRVDSGLVLENNLSFQKIMETER